MPPLAVAAVGAAASIGGGLLSASAQKKAASKAADTSLAVAEKNNALARESRDMAITRLDPYSTRGNQAGDAINALLGLGGPSPAAGTPGSAGTPQANPSYNRIAVTPNGSVMDGAEQPGIQPRGPGLRLLDRMLASGGANGAQVVPIGASPPPIVPPSGTGQPGTGAISAGQSPYQNAFQSYLNSTGYQFRVGEGQKAINQGYAAQGSLQSGAALKALQTYGQNTATDFFKDYLGLLANQQGVGLSGASAVAGVGQNYVNSVSANNNNAGSAAANAYLAQGNANANLYGNIAGAIGGVANAFGSSYRPGY